MDRLRVVKIAKEEVDDGYKHDTDAIYLTGVSSTRLGYRVTIASFTDWDGESETKENQNKKGFAEEEGMLGCIRLVCLKGLKQMPGCIWGTSRDMEDDG